MDALELAEVQNRFADNFRPAESQYSIIVIDRRQSLSDPNCVTKGAETDDLSRIPGLPPNLT